MKAQIIDVFAGPGGLGEGFSAYQNDCGEFPFEIALSVEMESYAHQTLRLRAFLRHFLQAGRGLPAIYVDYVTGKTPWLGELLAFRHFDDDKSENDVRAWELLDPKHYCPEAWQAALEAYSADWQEIEKAVKKALYEARRMTLGEADEEKIHSSIAEAVRDDLPTILIGGPPCQAFSTVGRSRRKGHVTQNAVEMEDGTKQWQQERDGRTWLYQEYIKIIDEFKPDIFVMENVRGMLSAKIKVEDGEKEHVWKRIFQDLHQPALTLGKPADGLEYHIYSLAADQNYRGGEVAVDGHQFVLHAEEFGIPQSRERVILLGVRADKSDLLDEDFITCLQKIDSNEQTSVKNAIEDLPALRAKVGCQEHFDAETGKTRRTNINKDDEKQFWHQHLGKQLTGIARRLAKTGDSHQEKVGKLMSIVNANHKAHFKKTHMVTDFDPVSLERTKNSIQKFAEIDFSKIQGDLFDDEHFDTQEQLRQWYSHCALQGYVLNHEARSHMDSDLGRYLYSSCYALIVPGEGERESPRLPELQEVGLDPKGHKNQASFLDRFRVQVWDKPATTVTSHIAKDGHYFIHPDPSQMRSMTVREAARLQTFPDNYFFEGPRTAQFTQVGNAVPPLLAKQVAEVVSNILLRVREAEQEAPLQEVC